jgi:uncharacterized OB-fold protein
MDITAYQKLLPQVKESNRPYWDGMTEGKLQLQNCSECGTFRFPDSGCCPNCLSDQSNWQPVSGKGRLWSWIVMHQQYYAAFADELPCLVAFVELDEGPFMMSTISGDTSGIACDDRVEAEFHEVAPGRFAHKFRVVK